MKIDQFVVDRLPMSLYNSIRSAPGLLRGDTFYPQLPLGSAETRGDPGEVKIGEVNT